MRLDAEAYKIALDDVERGEVCRAGHARVREPAPQSARFLKCRDAARSRQSQRHQAIRSAVRDERRLQSGLLAYIEREQKTGLHKSRC